MEKSMMNKMREMPLFPFMPIVPLIVMGTVVSLWYCQFNLMRPNGNSFPSPLMHTPRPAKSETPACVTGDS